MPEAIDYLHDENAPRFSQLEVKQPKVTKPKTKEQRRINPEPVVIE